MEKAEGKKTITIKQGTGEDVIEMSVFGTQEEFDMMEQLRQNNPEKWVGKDLELLQKARKAIKDKAIGEESKPSNPNKTRHKVSGFDIGMICSIALLWLLLIIYKLALVSMQKEVNEFRSEVGGFDVTENYFSSRKTGEFSGLFTGIGFADYGVLIPFTRLSDASAELSLKHDIENGVQLRESQKVLLDAIRLNLETEYMYGRNNTKWETIGLSTPVTLETLFWLLLVFFSIRKVVRVFKPKNETY